MNPFSKIIATTLLLTAVAATASAQDWRGMARLHGRVLTADGKPIGNVKVMLRSQRAGNEGPDLTTDKRGKWSALGLTGGQWNIDIEAEGYLPEKIVVNVSEARTGPTPPIEIKMQPAAARPQQTETAAAEPAIASTVPAEAVDAVRKGEEHVKAGNFKEAVVEFERAHALLPDHLQLTQALAQAYYKTGQLKQAAALLRKVYDAEPTNTGVLLLLINVLLESGDLEGGRQLLEKVPAEAMTEPTALINIGILFMNKEQPQEGYDYFARAVNVRPEAAEPYYYRALASVQLQKFDQAKRDFRKTVELAPDSAEAKDAKRMLEALK